MTGGSDEYQNVTITVRCGNAILRRLRSQPEDMFSFGEDASMGRGIPLMLAMSDRMTYNSEGTELLLTWKLQTKCCSGDGVE